MANSKKLLDEGQVRNFMKIAGLSSKSEDFVKKVLKEENSGRGKIFDPHGDDARHDNLQEEEVQEEGEKLEETDVQEEGEKLEEEEVQEEGKLTPTGPGKSIESGTGVSGTGKKPGKKVQYEGKLTPTGPGKSIESGTGVSGTGKKPGKKVQYEEVQEEGDKLEESPDEMGLDNGLDSEVELPPEAEMDDLGGEGGAPNIQGLVQAIAAAIQQETGVQISVEGGEGEVDSMEDPSMDDTSMPSPETDMSGEVPPPDEALEEDGMYDYKHQDPASKMSAGKLAESKKRAKLVEAVAQKVLKKLAEASKKNSTKKVQTKTQPKKK